MSGDMLTGWLLGLVMASAVFLYSRDEGRAPCEAALSRSEKCVQVWVPEAKKENAK